LTLLNKLSTTLRLPAATVTLVATLSACAGLPPQTPPITRAEGQETFATVYGTVAEKHIEPQKISNLAINGLNGLSRIDSGLAVKADGEWLTISINGMKEESFSIPADDDVESWAALSFDAYTAARKASPEIAAAKPPRIYKAIFETALAPLDRFSRYSTARKAKDNRAKRNGYGGIGLRFKVKDSQVIVTEVFKGGPAQSSGILRNDLITRIDGLPTDKMDQEQVKNMLRGKRGTKVSLVISRANEPRSKRYELARKKVVVPTVSLYLENGIAQIAIKGFNRDTSKEVRKTLEALAQRSDIAGIALDLRGNPGGLLKQSIRVADLFLADGLIVSQRGRHPASTQAYTADAENYLPDLPMVVLVDGRTASSSEVLATALQDRNRAVVIGTSSYGKGTVQTVIRLVNNGELTLTWSRLIPPSGYVMHELGVLPAICTNPVDSEGNAHEIGAGDALATIPANMDSLHRRAQSWRDLSHEESAERNLLRDSCPAEGQKDGPHLEIAHRLLQLPSIYHSLILGSTAPQTAKRP